MNGYHLVPARRSHFVDAIARRLIERAARRAPTTLSERLLEEWTADMSERLGRMARLRFAAECCWAALLIGHDRRAEAPTAALSAIAGGDRMMLAHVRHGMAPFPRPTSPSGNRPAICEINTTPLIDVLLVLIVTLIITLPMMRQAVNLSLPQSPPADGAPPEVVNLDIDFDGTVVWNGSPVASLAQLEGYFQTESRKYPQPEIHLRPDPYVKYDIVAKVLAAAQHNRLRKLGFVNTSEFAH